MSTYFTLVRRELGSFFGSFTGYLLIALVAWLLGLGFTMMLEALNGLPSDMPVTDLFYSTVYFWLVVLLSAPIITMRTFAQERATGTYETLMTAPVGDAAVVLAKFTASWLFYLAMWLPLLVCLVVIRHFSQDPDRLNLGPTASTFLGVALLGGLYMSVGCFASSLTRSQLNAAMLTFALGIGLFLVGFLSLLDPSPDDWKNTLIAQISLMDHMREFVRGVVDTRFVVFYLSLTLFFIFLTLKVVESRRWK
jgi:ABC-2 type transport system permease protein